MSGLPRRTRHRPEARDQSPGKAYDYDRDGEEDQDSPQTPPRSPKAGERGSRRWPAERQANMGELRMLSASLPVGGPISSSSEPAAGLNVIPPNLNWLNVPDAVKESVVALDRALSESRRECKRLESHVRRMEERMANLERVNDKLVRAVRAEQEKSHQLADAVRNIDSKPFNEDAIVAHAVDELRKAFHPEELRATLRKVEIASKQPQALTRRIEALEQFRLSTNARSSAAEQAKKTQRGRVEDAVSALRKLAA